MPTTDFYRQLISTIRDKDHRRIAEIMAGHEGEEHPINLDQIALQAFGEFNSGTERKAREVLEILVVTYHLAICSNSGKPGRWLAKNEEEREAAAKELETRGQNTLSRARALRMAVIPTKEMHFPRQPSLWR